MRFSLGALVPLLVVVLATSMCADELEELAIAQKALDAVPAYRATVVASSSMGPGTNRAVFVFQRPDLVHAKVEMNGTPVYEAFTDGKKAVLAETDGTYKDAPPALAAQIKAAQSDLPIIADNHHDFAHKVPHLTLAGHETINGVAASCYKGEGDNDAGPVMTGVHNAVKIWVSDQDHRPVRAEWSMRGMMKMDPHAEANPFNQEVQVTYDYDPGIKVVMPAAG